MRTKICFIVILVLLIGTSLPAMERFEIITTQDLEKMLMERESGAIDFTLANTLDEVIYRNSSIPGSVNVPWSRVKETINRLGENKEKLVITY